MTTVLGLLCISTANLQAFWDLGFDCFNSNPCFNLIVGAEGLYWTVDQRDLDYAIDVSAVTNTPELAGPGDVHFLDYHHKGGIRFWVGFETQNSWDLRFIYTSYHNHAHDNITSDGVNTLLLATLVHPGSFTNRAQTVDAETRLSYRTYDLLMGNKLSFYCEDFFIHPFIGLRGLTLDQHLKALYTGGDFETEGPTSQPGQIIYKSELNVLGLHAGMDFDYQFCYGFGFYGGFGGSILAGKSHAHQIENVFNADSTVFSNLVNIHERENVMIPGWNLKAGLSWNPCFAYDINMLWTVGYEFNQWFNTPQYRRFVNQECTGVSCKNSGIIGLHGVTVSVTLFY